MMSAVYPLMKMMGTRGSIARTSTETSRPFFFGITTSVTMRSMLPAAALNFSTASSPSTAAITR